MRRIETAAEWEALTRGAEGYIYNDAATAFGWSTQFRNTLHWAGCTTLSSQRPLAGTFARGAKYFAASHVHAARWLERERGREGTGWRRCGRCVSQRRLPAGTG